MFVTNSKMSESEQKLLWIQLNKKKLTTLAQHLDAAVSPHTLSSGDIDALIDEAKKNGKKKR